jgi:hypothetical protein
VKARCASRGHIRSKRGLSRNEQHEHHAVSFPVRRQSHLLRYAEIRSSQAHVATLSILKRVHPLPGFLALVAVCHPSEESLRHVLHREQASLGVLFSVIITLVSSTSSPSDLQLFSEQLLTAGNHMVEAQQEEDERKNSRHQPMSPAKKASFLWEESKGDRTTHKPFVVWEEPGN